MTGFPRAGAGRRAVFLAPSAYLWGGVQTWLDQTARGLRERGWQVTLGLVEGARFHVPAAYVQVHPGHQTVKVSCRTSTPEGRARAVVRMLEETRPDVLVIVNVADGLEGARRWKRTSAGKALRVVYSIHAFLAGQMADVLSYVGTVDRVVGANRLLEKALATAFDNGVPVGYAPYGTEAPLAMRQPSSAAGRPLRLAWVGRMEEPQKRTADLGLLMRRCLEMELDFRCDVVGDGPSAATLRSQLSGVDVAGKVRLLGYLPRERLYEALYPEVDALLLTSSWETGPIVAWEAMRHGATLVSTRYVGAREEGALKDGENCLLAEVGDIEGLARAVSRLREEDVLLERLRGNARVMADARYSLEASADAWDGQLAAALEAPAGRPALSAPRRTARGRLDRCFGPGLGETLRSVAGRVSERGGPGDEWPHELPEKSFSKEQVEEKLEGVFGPDFAVILGRDEGALTLGR